MPNATLSNTTKRAPRLAKLAEIIKATGRFQVEVTQGYCNTDRKPKGLRYITRKGKGRTGTRLIVRWANGDLALDHNAAETYRSNNEVVEWMRQNGIKL
jgi:hypothetical protein